MEPFYLVCSIIYNSITSLLLSCLLLLRRRRYCISAPPAVPHSHNHNHNHNHNQNQNQNHDDYLSFYEGTVWHERRRPVHHSFQYPVRYALIDLDKATNVPSNHLSGDEARRICKTNGPVFLLTIPPSVGYEQNPLSLYYCYNVEEGFTTSLKKCIAEVTNTPWGERVSFVFNPKSDTVAKPLHVSPFMDMFGSWSIKTNAPGDNLSVSISVQHPDLGNYFTATLRVKRTSTQVAGDPTLFFWLMPHRVAIWIYWHAVKLWWKGVPFIQHPRYHCPAYREEAILHDKELQSHQSLGWDEDNNQQAEASTTSNFAEQSSNARYFSWRDAKWPWC